MEAARRINRTKFILLIVCLVLLWYLGRFFRLDIETLEKSLNKFPFLYSSIIYVILYVVITFFIFFTKDIFWISGAVAYGPYLSALLIYVSEIINAFILFYFARSLGRNFVEHYLKKKSEALEEGLANISFPWLLIVRLVPLVPYRFLDLGVGLTRIHFRRYLAAVLLATPIRAFWVQYVLTAIGRNIFTKPELLIVYLLQNKTLFVFSLMYLALVIMAAFKLKHRF